MMNKAVNMLYDLNHAEGSLSWDLCQFINRALINIQQESIPRCQVSNVSDYIQQVLLWQSAIPEHRLRLANLLFSMRDSNS